MFGAQTVLDGVSFRINAGERVGVVGPNGAGKSTIFSLITGAMEPDRGEVVLPKNFRLGHLRQQLFAAGQDASLLGYTLNAIPELDAMESEMQQLEAELPKLKDEAQERALNRLGVLQHEFEHLGGYDLQSRAEAALSALGFLATDFSRPFKSFSGGWQMRAELARVLIANPDLLLLDEPSNYLDLPAIEWLGRYLRSFEGTMLLISHDRYLLRSLTNRTIEVAGGQTTRYQGGFDYYLRERESRYEQQLAEWQNYTRKAEQIESFIRRFRAKSTKAAQVQSRVKQLEAMEKVAKPVTAPDHSHLRIADPPHCGAKVMELQGAGFSYDGERWVFRDVELQINKGDKIALVGFNGMGKTTLLRSLAGTYDLAAGERRLGHKVVIGYQSQEFAETMPPDQSVLHVVKSSNAQCSEKEVRSLLGSFGFSAEAVTKPVKVLSGGEKIRLAFARIFINPPNFLLLDEPTTHLDIQGREALERAIRDYKGTVCLVSHDVEFVQNTAEQIVAMSPPGITRYAGNYDYYLEKTGLTTESLKTAPTQETKPEVTSVGSKGRSSRKARADQREAQKKLKRLERELEKLQIRQAEIHELMASQEASINYAELNKELAGLTEQIDAVEELWLQEAAQFE